MNESNVVNNGVFNSPLFLEKIEQLKTKKLSLSYSKLKNLTTPVNFMLNLVTPKASNAGMSFGSLVDLLMTNEDEFNISHVIVDTPLSFSTDKQKQLVEDTLNGDSKIGIKERFAIAFSQNYKKGSVDDYKEYFDFCVRKENGINTISRAEYNEALAIAQNMLRSPEIEDIMSQNEGLQHGIAFEYAGWYFRGILDILSMRNIYDLKFVSQLNPDTFQREIEKYGYDLQMAIYKKGLEAQGVNPNAHGHFITYDKNFNFAVMKFGDDYMGYAERKLDHYINRLEHMIKNNGFTRSYDFFEPNKIIRKPNWIKGFDETSF